MKAHIIQRSLYTYPTRAGSIFTPQNLIYRERVFVSDQQRPDNILISFLNKYMDSYFSTDTP